MSDRTDTPTMQTGDRLVARPCDVTVNFLTPLMASGHCATCDVSHIIDVQMFDAGRGPWVSASTPAPLMDALIDLVDAICDEMKDEVFHNDHVKAAMRRVCELIPSREPDDDDWWLM